MFILDEPSFYLWMDQQLNKQDWHIHIPTEQVLDTSQNYDGNIPGIIISEDICTFVNSPNSKLEKPMIA